MTSGQFLVINAGSSSVKFGVFSFAADPAAVERGSIEVSERDAALARLLDARKGRLAGVGHRIVHGGPKHVEPELVTPDVLDGLRSVVAFAPNHLPDEIALIERVRRLRPELPQIVCFDTAFHAALPPVARRLPIPRRYDEQGLRRYGFHGLSYTFLMHELRRLAPERADGRVVLAHLGNGSSLAAVSSGRPIDTSMGFTPLGGVVMSTRAGDIDPGVVTFIARQDKLDGDGLERVMSRESGLLGLSNRTADMRELLDREASDEGCRLAVAIYCYEIRKQIGAYVAALGGLDALVFAGGIGERAPIVRARICDGLTCFGIELDRDRNGANALVISTEASRVPVHVIETDEEVVIARAGYQLLYEHDDDHP